MPSATTAESWTVQVTQDIANDTREQPWKNYLSGSVDTGMKDIEKEDNAVTLQPATLQRLLASLIEI